MAEIRLNKLIKIFNIGLDPLVDFLNSKGAGIENANPNMKVSEEYLPALYMKFGRRDYMKDAEKVDVKLTEILDRASRRQSSSKGNDDIPPKPVLNGYQYHVFLSKNSADQALADSIFNFMVSSGLSVFESKNCLPKIGDADYSRAIFNALENSKNIVILCTSNENGSNSKWVYEEWSWFINEIRSKRRNGQVMTIRNGIGIEKLDPQLRKYESFEFDSFKSRILPYLR